MSFSSSGTFDGFEAAHSFPSSSGNDTCNNTSTNTSPSLEADAYTAPSGLGAGETSSVGAGLPWPLQTHHLQPSQSPEIVAQPYPNHAAYSTPQKPGSTYGLTHATPITPLNTQPYAKNWSQPSFLSPGTQGSGPLDRHSTLTPLVAAWNHEASPLTPTPGRVPGPQFGPASANAGPTTPRKRLSLSAASSPHNTYSPYAYPGSAGAPTTLPNGRPARPRVSLPPMPMMPSVHMPMLSSGSMQMRGGLGINHGFPSYVSPIHPLSYGMRMHPAPSFEFEGFPGGKPSRFKPTKVQLALLVDSYNRNQVPDAEERERLRSLLGPDVKAKTIQIWFQNRRSKSRTKERQAVAKRVQEGVDDDASGSGGEGKSDAQPDMSSVSPSEGGAKAVHVEALKQLAGDGSTIVPIQILAIGAWTRFLTPGSEAPDLGMSYSLFDSADTSSAMSGYTSPISPPGGKLNFYVKHAASSYRISIPLQLVQATLEPGSSVPMMSGQYPQSPTGSTQTVLTFSLPPNVATFAYWQDGSGWSEIDDFSGGAVRLGGRVEVTGGAELSRAFQTLQKPVLDPFSTYRPSVDGSIYSHSYHASISSVSSLVGGPFSASEPTTVNPFTARPSILHSASESASSLPTLQMPLPPPPPLQLQMQLQVPREPLSPIITPRASARGFPYLLSSALPEDAGTKRDGTGVQDSRRDDPFGLTTPLNGSPNEKDTAGSSRAKSGDARHDTDCEAPIVHSSPVTWPIDLPSEHEQGETAAAAQSAYGSYSATGLESPRNASIWPSVVAHIDSTGLKGAGVGVQMADGSNVGNWHSYVQGLDSEWLEASG